MKKNIQNKAILQPDQCKVTYTIFDARDTDWEDVVDDRQFTGKQDGRRYPSREKAKKQTDVWAELKKRKGA